ncbi:MAG: DUF3592 domain-containing protein [Amphiplicatus sp.]
MSRSEGRLRKTPAAEMQNVVTQRAELTIALAFFVALTAFGVFLCGAAVEDFAKARASADWPVAEGVVLSRRGENAALRYAYVAGGRSYESRRVRFLTANFLKAGPPAPPPGEAVAVRYDPDDAGRAVLQPGSSGAVFALLLAGAAILIFVGGAGLVRTVLLSQYAEEAAAGR